MVAPQKELSDGCAAIRHASEARDYFTTLVKVRGDQVAASVRTRATTVGLLVIAAIAIVTLLIVSTLALVRGVTGGFTTLFDGQVWLGELTGGIVLIAALAMGIAVFLSISARLRLTRLKRKYRNLHEQHRADHGRHISDEE